MNDKSRLLTQEELSQLKVGDTVTRNFCGIYRDWRITSIKDNLITIGMGWMFDLKTGAEVDDDLQWGPEHGITGSYLCVKS